MNRTIAEWQRKIDELRARGPFLMWELRVAELRGWITKNGYRFYIGDKSRSSVTSIYKKNATPGIGDLSHDPECEDGRFNDELKFAEWIHNNLGGDIRVLKENNTTGVRNPDYLWNGKLWDLKTPNCENAANGLVRTGMKQILSNPGGVMLNFGNQNISLNKLEQVLDKRMKWYKDRTVDIMVVSGGKLIKVYRYKK